MGLQLHPKLGVNPHMTYCPRCGGEGKELILVGVRNYVTTCLGCGTKNYGSGTGNRCGKCKEPMYNGEMRQLTEHERLPGSLCDECEKEAKLFETVVAAGGVFFKCKCGKEGVIKSTVPLAKAIREHAKIEPPKPVGVELDKCPHCEEKKE